MKTRKLGRSDLHFSVVGLGTWAMGGGEWAFGWGPQEEAESIGAILAAAAAGVNWVDTAAVYGFGIAEETVGKALRQIREPMLVATKCGLAWDDQGRIEGRLRRESVLAECDASLRRLGVDVIDLYQIHWPRDEAALEEGWDAISTLIEQGKVRYAGVSNFSVDQMKRVQALAPIASLQPPYHLLQRDIETEILPFCREHDIGVIAYSPMARGLLTGKVTPAWVAALDDSDHRKHDPAFQSPQLEENLKKVESVVAIADRLGCRPAHVAVAWVLHRPEITAAIVGGRSAGQARENALAAEVTLSDADLAELDGVFAPSAE